MSSATLMPPQTPSSVLADSPIPQLRRLHVTMTDFEVVITGTVPSYYLKQLAQEAVRNVVGRRRIVNRVVVPQPISN